MSEKYRIRVEARAEYLPEQSSVPEGRYAFAYHIRIQNVGDAAARLVSRHWLITDSEGVIQEVRGMGVVGEQPTLQPGESFEYSSGCTIATPVGTMRGSYQMEGEEGMSFDAEIGEFMLIGPRVLH